MSINVVDGTCFSGVVGARTYGAAHEIGFMKKVVSKELRMSFLVRVTHITNNKSYLEKKTTKKLQASGSEIEEPPVIFLKPTTNN